MRTFSLKPLVGIIALFSALLPISVANAIPVQSDNGGTYLDNFSDFTGLSSSDGTPCNSTDLMGE
ncbi:MAG: hypothetical protein ACI9MR_002988, partial [Myxococcota bacterium]